MKKVCCLLFCLVFFFDTFAVAGLSSNKAMYVGGTVSQLKERTEGTASLSDPDDFVFSCKGSTFKIPYKSVNSLEYGQKAGRRLGLAIAISPLLLFSKKRRHYLTIGFLDDTNRQQAAVFELGKDAIQPTLSGLETKTGKKIDFEDDEARKTALKK